MAPAHLQDIRTAELTQVVDGYRKVQAPATVLPPAGARDLEMWFENGDRSGCHQWDSDCGRNFHVALQ